MEMAAKVLLSLLAGGAIGLEREVSGHPAGLRTMILVSTGSATFVMIGVYGLEDVEGTTRIIQGVATGLGFIGAGAIIKEGFNVRGLTTAASVWMTAAIGGSIGMGLLELALMSFLVTIVSLSILGLAERMLDIRPDHGRLLVTTAGIGPSHADLTRTLRRMGVVVEDTGFRIEGGAKVFSFDVVIPIYSRRSSVMDRLRELEGVRKIAWREGLSTSHT